MKYRVAELEGALLDAAVAHAAGYSFKIQEVMSADYRSRFDACLIAEHGQQWSKRTTDYRFWSPSRKWEEAGPIIQRERIEVVTNGDEEDPACGTGWHARHQINHWWDGPTPLIATMRAYVASKFGEEVELP